MLCCWFFFSPSSWRPNCCHIVLAFWGFLIVLVEPVPLQYCEQRHFWCTCFPLPLCSSQNWQGQANAHLIWWSVTEDSLMLHPLRTPTVTPRRLFFFFILANCTDIQVLDLTKKWILVENAEKNVLKVGRPTAIIFLFCNSWVDCSYSRISSLFFEASRRPLRALWFVPSWFTDNWVVLCRLASKGFWQGTPFESTGNVNLNCCN